MVNSSSETVTPVLSTTGHSSSFVPESIQNKNENDLARCVCRKWNLARWEEWDGRKVSLWPFSWDILPAVPLGSLCLANVVSYLRQIIKQGFPLMKWRPGISERVHIMQALVIEKYFSSINHTSITSYSASFCVKCLVCNSNGTLLQADLSQYFSNTFTTWKIMFTYL